MNCRCAQLLFSISLILLLERVTSERKDYEKIFEAERIADKLRLLQAEVLIENFSAWKDVNSTCVRDLAVYEKAIRRGESWALKMLDSSSRTPTGVLHGHIVELGMYDECVEAKDSSSGIRGRHCTYTINPSLQNNNFFVKPTLSICLPTSCGADDLVGLLNRTIEASEMLKELRVTLSSASCMNLEPRVSDRKLVVCAIIAATFIGILILSTLCDLLMRRCCLVVHDSSILQTLAHFSMLKSAERILSTKSQAGSLPVIHGIRAISTAWIVFSHEYMGIMFQANINTLYFMQWLSSWRSMFVFIGVYTVDTFMTLSGFLVAYTFFKKIEKENKFNIFLYYLHRYIRLTPPVVAFVTAALVFLPVLSAGPLYDWMLDNCIVGCESKLWSIFLYIQNFVERNNYCLLHLWSLSVDMQLFWISPVILYPLQRRPKVGLAILAFLLLVSVITSGWILGINKYSSLYISHDLNVPLLLESVRDIYVMPYTRASPWLLGLLFGYMVTRKSFNPSKVILCAGWLLACAAFMFCLYGIRSITNINYEYNLMCEVIFGAVSRPIWGFGVCWIIYASHYEFAGPISTFLSWKIFLPMSKISYIVYLFHVTFPMVQAGVARAPKHLNDYYVFHSFLSNFGLSLVTGFFLSLLFEAPFSILEEMIFKKKSISIHKTQKLK